MRTFITQKVFLIDKIFLHLFSDMWGVHEQIVTQIRKLMSQKLEKCGEGVLVFYGIIEGGQSQVAAFSLEHFSYLTGFTLGQ